MRYLSFALLLLPTLLVAQGSRVNGLPASNADMQQALATTAWNLGNVSDKLMASIYQKYTSENANATVELKRINLEFPIGFRIIRGTGEDRNLLFIDTDDHKFEYRLVDFRNKIVLSEIIYSKHKQINLSRFPSGTYFLQVEQIITHKVVIGG